MEPDDDRRALVTGASSGIGAAFARALARRGRRLLIVARRAERLARLSEELGGEARALPMAVDLAEPGAIGRLREEITRRRIGVDLLVNNAGIGATGRYAEEPATTTAALLALNVAAAAELLRAFLPGMLEHRRGAIINVCSMSAFQPVPYLASYAASKAFLLSLTESVAEETRGTGVTIQALCPGLVATEFQARAGTDKVAFNSTPAMTPDFVAEASLRALDKGRLLVIPGWRDRVLVQVQRLAPRSLVRRAGAQLFRPPA